LSHTQVKWLAPCTSVLSTIGSTNKSYHISFDLMVGFIGPIVKTKLSMMQDFSLVHQRIGKILYSKIIELTIKFSKKWKLIS